MEGERFMEQSRRSVAWGWNVSLGGRRPDRPSGVRGGNPAGATPQRSNVPVTAISLFCRITCRVMLSSGS